IRRSWPEAPESKESGRPPRVDGDGFLRYRLGWEPILAVKVIILRGEQREDPRAGCRTKAPGDPVGACGRRGAKAGSLSWKSLGQKRNSKVYGFVLSSSLRIVSCPSRHPSLRPCPAAVGRPDTFKPFKHGVFIASRHHECDSTAGPTEVGRKPCQIHQLQTLAGCTRRIWTGIQVKCGNHDSGCGWTGGIGDYEDHARTTCVHANVTERSERRIHELEQEKTRLMDRLQTSESARISVETQLADAKAKNQELKKYEVQYLLLKSLNDLKEVESKRLFNGQYDFGRHDVVRLAQLISKHLEDKPSEIDRNKIYDCIRGCYNDLDRGYSDNPAHYYMDMRMLLATCLASTWFSNRQRDSLIRWYSEKF
ncbi:hypothetical protein THAOC_36823, partial [Thalassiosira oceanica]